MISTQTQHYIHELRITELKRLLGLLNFKTKLLFQIHLKLDFMTYFIISICIHVY